MRSTSDGSVTSAWIASALPPRARMSATTSSVRRSLLSTTTTVAPWSQKSLAVAAPMPPPPPLMTAIRPGKSGPGRSMPGATSGSGLTTSPTLLLQPEQVVAQDAIGVYDRAPQLRNGHPSLTRHGVGKEGHILGQGFGDDVVLSLPFGLVGGQSRCFKCLVDLRVGITRVIGGQAGVGVIEQSRLGLEDRESPRGHLIVAAGDLLDERCLVVGDDLDRDVLELAEGSLHVLGARLVERVVRRLKGDLQRLPAV